MGLKEDYRLKKLKKEMHRLHCEITKCCDGEGGDGLTCEDLENCQEIIDIKDSIPTNNSELVNDSGYLACEDLDECQTIRDIIESIPTNNSELVNDSGYITCADLTGCPEIEEIINIIPTDVSDLSDTNGILLEYKGEHSSAPSSPQKGWFYKNTDNGVMYYFDGTNWIAYAEGGGGGGGIIFIERSLPDLHTDISNGVLIPGATYKITGVHKTHTVDDIQINALYDDGRDLGTTIFLKAISENELETFGSGIFYNPKYDKQVQGFGIWFNKNTYNVDDIVFWGGYVWKNLNRKTGSSTDALNLNEEWEKLNYDDVNYNKVIDYIEYDIENDIITRRYDTVNEIDVSSGFFDIITLEQDYSSISLMQWGNDLYLYIDVSEGKPITVIVGVGNISVKHLSFVELINFKGAFIYNVNFDNGSRLQDVTFDNGSNLQAVTFDNGSRLQNVTFDNGSWLQNVTFDNGSWLQNVTFDNGTSLNYVNFDNGSWLQNVTFYNRSILSNVNFDNGSRLQDVTFDNGSNLQAVTFDNGTSLNYVNFDNGSRLQDVTFDNGSNLQAVTFDKGSRLQNVTFDNGTSLNYVTLVNSSMRQNTFISFVAIFNYQTYSNLDLSNIKFEGNGNTVYTIPDISLATIITDPNIPQKKVFGIDATTIKIQYWDSVSNDFVVADITD